MRWTCIILITVICIIAVTFMTTLSRAQGCGPGPHWIDVCSAGVDSMYNTMARVGVDMDFDCIVDTNLTGYGSVIVDRSDPLDDSNNYPGLRPVDGHLDVIDAEIISMALANGGITVVAGEGHGQGGVLGPSLGAIAEQPSDPSLGDSFFDVFFEINMGGVMYIYNHDPLRIEAVIDRVPPFGVIYIKPPGCLPLYTSPSGGSHVSNLVTAELHIISEDIPTLSEWGMIILALLLLAAGTIAVVRRRRAFTSNA